MSSKSGPHTPEIRGQVAELPRLQSVLAALLCLLGAGCADEEGPERVAVHGTVRLGGEPLASGQIRFIPTDDNAGPAAAATITDGHYEFDDVTGPVVGTHRVEIEATNYLGFEIDDEQAFASFAESGENRNPERTRNPVPPVYNDQSTLTRTVEAGDETVLDFELDPNAKVGDG